MNISIRNWEEEDIDDLVKYTNNRNVWNSLADAFPSPYTEFDAKEFIKKVQSRGEPL